MTKKKLTVLLVVLVIIAGAIGGAIIFLTRPPSLALSAAPAVGVANAVAARTGF